MGHFSHNCKLTGLPITGDTQVALIVMKPNANLWDNSEQSLKKYGTTYMCSNDGTRFKYTPVWFPIRGTYNDYGGIENIVEDDNTKLLEEFYGLEIQEIMDIITSGRKDDGYDDSLSVIKKPVERPANQLEGEDHFKYYQRITNNPIPCGSPDLSGKGREGWDEEGYEGWTVIREGKKVKATKAEYDADFKLIHEHYAEYNKWKERNPDVEDDYGKPEYEDRYKELVSYSGMWVHGEVYDKLTSIQSNDEYDKLDMGRPEILEVLGFVEGEKTDAKRFNRPFTHGKLTVMSDGNWMDGSIYTVSDFKVLAEAKGEQIDFSAIDGKGMIEQLYDVVVPTLNLKDPKTKAVEILRSGEKGVLEEIHKELYPDGDVSFKEFVTDIMLSSICDEDRNTSDLYYYFLNTGGYNSNRMQNPLTKLYISAAQEGKIRDNLVRFWKFDKYMHSCGQYYEVVGTGPQDGAHEEVQTVLNVAKTILDELVKVRKEEWGDDY